MHTRHIAVQHFPNTSSVAFLSSVALPPAVNLPTASYDDFLPIHIFDTSGRLVVSVLREAATPSGREILTLVKRVVCASGSPASVCAATATMPVRK